MTYEPGPLASATILLSPLALAIAAQWPAGKGHWSAPLLAAPSLILGLILLAALFNNAAGPGILGVLVYGPILLAVGGTAVVRWHRRRAALR